MCIGIAQRYSVSQHLIVVNLKCFNQENSSHGIYYCGSFTLASHILLLFHSHKDSSYDKYKKFEKIFPTLRLAPCNNYLFLDEFGSVYISKFLNEWPSFFLAKNQSFIFHIPLNLGETSPSVSIFLNAHQNILIATSPEPHVYYFLLKMRNEPNQNTRLSPK